MSQSTRQAAHHLHLVRLNQACRPLSFLTFCFYLFRDVNDPTDDLEQRTVGRAEDRSFAEEPPHGAIGSGRFGALCRDRRPYAVPRRSTVYRRAVFRMDHSRGTRRKWPGRFPAHSRK